MTVWDQIAWAPICIGLTAVGLVASWLLWRRKGPARGLRAGAWSLLPLAAYLTGGIVLIGRIGSAVGRFAAGGHDKRQDAMVAAFKRLCDAGLTGWRLHLAGSVHQDAHHAGHFEVIERASAGYPVTLHPDILQEGLQRLYREASIYWHSAGLGVDEEADPAALEHFGMTTVEAMGHGAVPVVIGRGGQSEIVRDGIDGFLWLDPRHLIDLTSKLVGDSALRRRLGESARERSHLFSREVFALRLTEALEPLLADRG